MKVELLKPIAGKAYFKGDIIELTVEQARAYIESGHCIPANEEMQKFEKQAQAETAESQAKVTAENAAVLIKGGKKKRGK